jgi:hypothetical protein
MEDDRLMAFLLLVADPAEKVWSIIAQTDDPDDLIDEVGQYDPSLRIVINTETFITFDTREQDNGNAEA